MTQYVSGEDWRQFAEEHPAALRFLSRANLRGEVRSLRAELPRASGGRREWIAARLQSLADIDAAFPALTPICPPKEEKAPVPMSLRRGLDGDAAPDWRELRREEF